MDRFPPSRHIVVFLGLIALLLAGPGFPEIVDRIVAQVNDEIITQSELDQMAKSFQVESGMKPRGPESQTLRRQMLDALIDRKLAREEAKKRGITVSDREVEDALKIFKERNHISDDEALKKGLAQGGLTLNELKQQIADQITQERLIQVAVKSKVTISDADVHRVYEEHYKRGGIQIRLRLITLLYPPGADSAQKAETRKKAEGILQESSQGASFAAVARKYGVSETDLGFLQQSDINPKLADFLKNLKPGGVAPVETPQGFQLFQLVDRRTGQARSFEEAAPEIRRILTQQEMQKHFSEWVKTLRQNAHIKILL